MDFASIVAKASAALQLAKAYWPVVTAGIVLASKVVSGDQSGVSEAVAMLLSAWGSIHGTKQAVAAAKAVSVRATPCRTGEFPSYHGMPPMEPCRPVLVVPEPPPFVD